jgi:hypothetical protein
VARWVKSFELYGPYFRGCPVGDFRLRLQRDVGISHQVLLPSSC